MGEHRIGEHEYDIVLKDRTNLWDQLREMMWIQKWTTQDVATTSLLQEMDNVTSIFIVRKTDGYLLGATILIETADLVYGNVYVMREGYRAAGMGMKLVGVFQDLLGSAFASKPFIARGAETMMGKYKNAPFYCNHLYELYSFQFQSREELCQFIPAPALHEYTIVAVRDMSPRQFQQMCDYDKFITGVDREKFLQDYYSLSITEGVVLYNDVGEIKGMAGLTPTMGGLFKLNPIYAETKEDAGILVNAVSRRASSPRPSFVLHCRTQSAGDWLLKKCTDQKIPLYRVGVLCNATNLNQIYVDPSKTEFMFAPTNSPAHFDG